LVLDDRVSSAGTAPGTAIRLHLQEPLVVNGATVAPAGTPGSLVVVTTRRAQSGDIDGAIQIHLNPLKLPSGQTLPVRAFHEYLTIERTAGQESTRQTTDTLADIFIPYHVLYHAFRKGREMVLPVGSVLRVETNATIDATNPHALVISTPPPFTSDYDTPHSDLTPLPFYTPLPIVNASPRGGRRSSPSTGSSPAPPASAGPSTGPPASATPGAANTPAPSPSPASTTERKP
jgi:hypothetical protein